MSWLSNLFKGKSSSGNKNVGDTAYQYQQMTYDPLQSQKTAVATPLSEFLSKSVGKGLGMGPETDPNYTNRYNEFLSMNPSQYFDSNIGDPAIKRYKEDFLPIIREGFAGNLRGSGRFNEESAGINRFSEDLAGVKANFVPQFAQSQIQVGQSEFQRRYQTWYQSLPETNPVLSAAINFLNSGKQDTVASANQFYPYQPGYLSQVGAAGVGGNILSGRDLGEIAQDPKFWIQLATMFGGM